MGDAGVVDQDVGLHADAAQVRHGLVVKRPHLRRIGDVAAHLEDLMPLGAQAFGGGRQLLGGARRHHHCGALLREEFRRRGADAAAAAGDHRALAGERCRAHTPKDTASGLLPDVRYEGAASAEMSARMRSTNFRATASSSWTVASPMTNAAE